LGSTIQEDGGADKEMSKRIQAGWNGWRKIAGIMCDRKAPEKLKEQIYKTMVRPAMTYGLETVALTKKPGIKVSSGRDEDVTVFAEIDFER